MLVLLTNLLRILILAGVAWFFVSLALALINGNWTKVGKLLLILLGFIAVLTAASLYRQSDTPPVTTTPPNVAQISQSELGEAWPFTVSEGELRCSGQEITFTTNGLTYAVNGTARANYPAIDPIWKDNPEILGTKINIAPLIERGQTLCR